MPSWECQLPRISQILRCIKTLGICFEMSIRRYDIETEKNKILFRSLLLWFIRGERRKYGDSQREYIASLLSKWLEIRLGDRQSNAFFLFFSFYKIEIIQKSIIWRLFKRSINHIMIWINLTIVWNIVLEYLNTTINLFPNAFIFYFWSSNLKYCK